MLKKSTAYIFFKLLWLYFLAANMADLRLHTEINLIPFIHVSEIPFVKYIPFAAAALLLIPAKSFVSFFKNKTVIMKLLPLLALIIVCWISTFYAELKRIKQILDASKSDPDTLFLIDEIFRGTNSVDRLEGAKTVITKLNKLNAIGMMTTHDLELCDLQQTIPHIQNYSFTEYYENKKICFDYKIRDGRSQTTNAKYLMELIGII